MDDFSLTNHDLLVRAGWQAKTTRERWQMLRKFRSSLVSVDFGFLPSEVEDFYWEAVRRVTAVMVDDRISAYLWHPLHWERRFQNMMNDVDDPDEWVLLAAEPVSSAWAEPLSLEWERSLPPFMGMFGEDVSDEGESV